MCKISGFVNMSYMWHLNNPPDGEIKLRAYDDQADTALVNAVHIKLAGELSENARYTIELDGGHNSVSETGSFADFQEAYIDVASPDSGIAVRAGKFEALSGMEGMDATDNATISRGLLFTLARPRFYTGALLGYSSDRYDVGIGVVHGWNSMLDTDDEQSVLAKVGITPNERLGINMTYLEGPETAAPDLDRSTFDISIAAKMARKATVSLEYTTTTEETAGGPDNEWAGFGVQGLMTPTESFAVAIRFELLWDSDDALVKIGTPCDYTSITVAPTFRLNPTTTLRFEFRNEKNWGATLPFLNGDGTPTDTQPVIGAELIMTF